MLESKATADCANIILDITPVASERSIIYNVASTSNLDHLPVHELQYTRYLDLRGSAQAIAFLFLFVVSKNNGVHDGLRTNQAMFKCKNHVIHSSYVHVLVATAVLQSLSLCTSSKYVGLDATQFHKQYS